MSDPSPFRLAAAAALRFLRQHGPYRALRLTIAGLATLGPRGLVRRAAADARQREDDGRYQAWLAAHPLTSDGLAQLQADVAALPFQPTISLIVPVFNTDLVWLHRCVDSVRGQVYPHWQLCLGDDGSTRRETIAALEALARDERIRIARAEVNAGIVQASNVALALATGEFIGFLDHDDELAPHALAEVVRCLNADRDLDVVYSDEDKIDETGALREPHFKPDWSPELLRSCMYMSHFTVMRRSLVVSCGGFRSGTDGAQDYDLALRATSAARAVAHVPQVLYHWRMAAKSAASSQLGKRWAIEAGRRVLEADLQRRGLDAEVVPAEAAGHYRVRYRIAGSPLVSMLVSRRSSERDEARFRSWLDGIGSSTGYGRREIVVVPVDGSLDKAAASVSGDYLVVLDALTSPESADWIETLLELSQQPDVGAAGGIVFSADGTIDNAGAVLTSGGPMPAFRGERAWTRGHLANILDIRDVGSLDSAALMTRRTVFDRVGGFSAAMGAGWHVDYSLRVRRAGFRLALTPYARFRREAGSAGGALPEEARARLRAAHGDLFTRDPYYNPNFDQEAGSFRLPT